MITAVFYCENDRFKGFKVSGHANGGEYGHDILCAGVSSAVMLTINTLTDFLQVKAKPLVLRGAGIKIAYPTRESDAVILSLEAHLKLLAAEASGGKIKIVRKTYAERKFD